MRGHGKDEMKITIDETKIEYRHSKSWPGMLIAYTGRWFRNIATIIPIYPPYKYKGIKGWFKRVGVAEIGKLIRIEPKNIETSLQAHKGRLKLYDFLSTSTYFILAILMAILIVIYVAYEISQMHSAMLSSVLRSH